MTRAEIRRSKREQEKAQTATYNFTQAQLDALIQEKIGAKLEQSKQEIYEQTVNTTLRLSMIIFPEMTEKPLSLSSITQRVWILRDCRFDMLKMAVSQKTE